MALAATEVGAQAGAQAGTQTLASAIAEEARLAGIRRAFGIPGGEVLGLIDALRLAGTEFVLCNHESSAGIMASAYGRVSGEPGLVLATLGPGAANLLLPLANAQVDREALVAICGDLSESWPLSHTHQRLDLLGIFGPVTKHCAHLTPREGAATFRAALHAISERPRGSALLTISTEASAAGAASATDVTESQTDPSSTARPASTVQPASTDRSTSPAEPIAPASGVDPARDAELLRDRLTAAERPLVVAGCGAYEQTAPALREWIERWQLPIALTPKAKGLVGDDYKRFAGVLDGAGLGSLMTSTIAESDLVVGLGLDPVELIRTWHASAPVVWVGDCGPEPPGGLCRGEGSARLLSPVGEVLAQLSDAQAPRSWADWTAEAVATRRSMLADESLLTWIPRALRQALPHDAILTTDVGSHKCLAAQFLETGEPGSFLTSNGLSAMGYGLPAAIGAKLARPDTAVVAVVGDGGFAMAAQELETAARLAVPIVVVALIDTSLSLIQLLQQARGLPRCGVDYGRVDVEAIAVAHGANGLSATTPKQLRNAVASGLESHRPTVIAVPVDGSAYQPLL